VGADLSQGDRRDEEGGLRLAREQAARRAAEAAAHQARARAEAAERRTELLTQAGAVLSARTDYRATLVELARLALPHLGDWCIVDLVHEGGTFERLAVVHRDAALEKRAAALVGPLSIRGADAGVIRALRTGQVESGADVSSPWLLAIDEPHHDLVADLGLRAYVTAPLVARQQTLGAMTMVSAGTHPYAQAEILVVLDLARRAALAVHAAVLEREGEARKNEFLSTLSHELRTPLTAMLGWLRLLRTGTLDPDTAAHAIETVERNSRWQTHLIEDLLDVSRLVMGAVSIERRAVDLVSVVEAAVATVTASAQEKSITLDVALDLAARNAPGDSGRLQQVVENLLVNAIAFTPPGGRVSVHLDRAGAFQRITVADTGDGIEPALLPHVFEDFRRGGNANPRARGGLGLGLAIVRGVVELHGGRVAAQSDGRGLGSRITVKLPRAA
jgi:signal transduction histidine kinase